MACRVEANLVSLGPVFNPSEKMACTTASAKLPISTLIGMASIKTRRQYASVSMWTAEDLSALLVGMSDGTAAVENSIITPQKMKQLLCDPQFCVLKARTQRNICMPMILVTSLTDQNNPNVHQQMKIEAKCGLFRP